APRVDAHGQPARRDRPRRPRSGDWPQRFVRSDAHFGILRPRDRGGARRRLRGARHRSRLMKHEDAGIELVPRFMGQGYDDDQVRLRREWIERTTGVQLPLVASGTIQTAAMRGNIENPIGTVQMPVGVAGPLLVNGAHATGTFYVPMATTE